MKISKLSIDYLIMKSRTKKIFNFNIIMNLKEVDRISKYLESHNFIENGIDKLLMYHYCTPDKNYIILFEQDDDNLYLYKYVNEDDFKIIKWFEDFETLTKHVDLKPYFRKSKIDNI